MDDDDDLKQDIGMPLAGDGDDPFVPPEDEPQHDEDDYFDRELREVEQELEGTDPLPAPKKPEEEPEE